MITINDHSIDYISTVDLETFCENLSPIGLDRLKTALFLEQRERDKRARFNEAKEEFIRSLKAFQNAISDCGGDYSISFAELPSKQICLPFIESVIDDLTLGDFKN